MPMLRVAICTGLLILAAGCSDSTGKRDLGGGQEGGAADAAPPDAAPRETSLPDGSDDAPNDAPPGDAALADARADGLPGDAALADRALLFDLPTFPDGFNPTNFPACNGKILLCSNGMDDDGDLLVDAQDPECTGPCDNDEGSYELAIPGVNSAVCQQDCYWDDDSGSGFDKCEWNLKCDPLSPGAQFSPPCPYDQGFVDQGKCPTAQVQQCLDFCLPVTPNGCDCFGCCAIYVNGVRYKDTVYLGSGKGCTAATPQGCAPCTQVADCLDPCGDCELCLGKTLADLPAKCWQQPPRPDGGVPDGAPPIGDGAPPVGDGAPPADGGIIILPIQCPPGIDPCIDNSYCKSGFYCLTGCCKSSLG
jgi:hypothetical protein